MIFVHNNAVDFQRGTFAITPLKKKILSRLNPDSGMGIIIPIGVSFVHPNDPFNRAIGRQVASANLTPRMAFLTHVTEESGRTIRHFEAGVKKPTFDEVELKICFGFSTINESENTHVEYCFFSPVSIFDGLSNPNET